MRSFPTCHELDDHLIVDVDHSSSVRSNSIALLGIDTREGRYHTKLKVAGTGCVLWAMLQEVKGKKLQARVLGCGPTNETTHSERNKLMADDPTGKCTTVSPRCQMLGCRHLRKGAIWGWDLWR